jgi:hypothetical protein
MPEFYEVEFFGRCLRLDAFGSGRHRRYMPKRLHGDEEPPEVSLEPFTHYGGRRVLRARWHVGAHSWINGREAETAQGAIENLDDAIRELRNEITRRLGS